MKESMIQEALALFDIKGASAVEEINRNMGQWEYCNSVNELRKADKILAQNINQYGRSPEEILIEREKRQKILHFLLWVKKYLQTQNPEDWDIWSDWIVYGIRPKELAKKYNVPYKSTYKRLHRVTDNIRKMLPVYDNEYGSLKEYLED